MPAKPVWTADLPRIIKDLETYPELLDRAAVEALLGTGRRRAQQILAGCETRRIGASSLTTRQALIERIQCLANGHDAHGADREAARRRRLAASISQWQAARQKHPTLLVEAPAKVVSQRLNILPSGVTLAPGTITVKFHKPEEALEKLLALAMAIGNDFEEFIQKVT